jgi:hypothetical protein
LKTWKTMCWKERLQVVTFSLLPALVLVLLAQSFAYMTVHRDSRWIEDPETGHPIAYQMTFGKGWFAKTTITPLNALGYPDREFVNIKPKGDCVHVVFSGDSFVFGDAVDRNMNFVSVLERTIARNHPDRCIRLFNIGQRMTTIPEQVEQIRMTRTLLDPDIVILGQYQNDLLDLTIRGDAPGQDSAASNWWGGRVWRNPLTSSSLVRYLTYRSFAFMITRDIRYDALAQWSVLADSSDVELAGRLTSLYRESFLELVDELLASEIQLGTIVLPSKMDLLAGRYPEEEFFVGLAREAGVPYLTVFDALDSGRRNYPFQMYDGHLSEAGNAMVSRKIYAWLFAADGEPPFAVLYDESIGTTALKRNAQDIQH